MPFALQSKFAYALSAVLLLAGLTTAAPTFAQQAPQAPLSGSGSLSQSYNWAGYLATTGTFTGVSGSWVIPTVASSTNLSADATWVGIGGVTTQDLIQVGTQAVVQNNQTNYSAWTETLPGDSQPLSLSVAAGDVVSASVTNQGGNQWGISFTDDTNNQTYNTTVSYNSSESSAEWIEEMPSSGFGLLPLDNFGTVNFTNASAIENGAAVNLTSANSTPMNMITQQQGHEVLASPSAVTNSNSFSVTRSAVVASTSSFGTVPFRRSRVGVGVNGFAPGTNPNSTSGTTPTSGNGHGNRSSGFHRQGFSTGGGSAFSGEFQFGRGSNNTTYYTFSW